MTFFKTYENGVVKKKLETTALIGLLKLYITDLIIIICEVSIK